MIKAFYVKNRNGSSLNLWRTEKHKFQIIKNGRFLDLLTGSDYILIHKKYLPIFASISSDLVGILPVQISRKVNDKTRDDYFEIKVKKQFLMTELSLFGKDEKVVWSFPTQYQLKLIVSEAIKFEWENIEEEKFIFSDDEKDVLK
jgi:hypothetical protein